MSDKKICALFTGGKCPFCDSEHEIVGISYQEAQDINAECCRNSFTPNLFEFSAQIQSED